MSDTDYADEFSGEEDFRSYDGFHRESDEDTEDASETDLLNYEGEYTEIKDQMYQDKLHNLKEQLKQLEDGTHPEFLKRFKKIEQVYKERIVFNEAFLTYENERIDNEFSNEKLAAVREFEERKIELKENLIQELEDKKKMIESERMTLELNADALEPKPVTTRKLRRRPNDPTPVPEKRRRASPQTLNIQLDDNEIQEDLKAIAKAINPKYSSSGSSKKGDRDSTDEESGKLNGRLSAISEEDESSDDDGDDDHSGDDDDDNSDNKSDSDSQKQTRKGHKQNGKSKIQKKPSESDSRSGSDSSDSDSSTDSSSMDDSSTCSNSDESTSSAIPDIECQFVDGRLLYNNEYYKRGEQILVQQAKGDSKPRDKKKKKKSAPNARHYRIN